MAATVWNKAPFLRILTALTTGIILQWYGQVPWLIIALCFGISISAVVSYSFTYTRLRYQLRLWNGFFIVIAIMALGAALVWQQDVRNDKHWAGHSLSSINSILVKIEEPLVEKANSYKAVASFISLYGGDTPRGVEGQLLIYFKKDSVPPPLRYGSVIVFTQNLQEIKNGGNPGSFDYKTYSLFHGITHQAYLTQKDYAILPDEKKDAFKNFIFSTRSWVVNHLKTYITGSKEQGLAEALLIGYKDDLDKNLVEAYSNTGVVHIIAISGLHLGLIYVILIFLTKGLKRKRHLVFLRFLIIAGSLWLFSLLAGAQPSVLRSALMFTVIAGGEVVLKRTNVFNTLACSACILLCINPFWLWDVGFQLSYAAVVSIVLFFQPVYHWYNPENKLLDFFWKLTAVTTAAQILTIPISIYHFHQMPVLFLVANFVAVPLSSAILIVEIVLCLLFFLAPVAKIIGIVLTQLIYWMNSYIEQLDKLPFAVWNFLSITMFQTALLLVVALASSYWLLERRRTYGWIALTSFALFMLARSLSFYTAEQQQKLIVYNVPKHTAIDIVNGRHYYFLGDSALLYDDFARNFHLRPSRILHRITPLAMNTTLKSFEFNNRQCLVIDDDISFKPDSTKQKIDIVILSKNPRLYISKLTDAFAVRQVVIDGSVPPWKAAIWKKDCDSLNISCYNVSEQGAYVLDLHGLQKP